MKMAKRTAHIGENIRAIRQLKGMKQEVFAQKLGVAQQNISKMEKKAKVSPKKLEEAAQILGVTVETVKKFNEKAVFNSNIAFEQNSGQTNHINSTKEIIEYFKDELSKKDAEIKELKDKYEALKNDSAANDKPDAKLSAIR